MQPYLLLVEEFYILQKFPSVKSMSHVSVKY